MIANIIIIYLTVGCLLALIFSSLLWSQNSPNLTNSEFVATIFFWPVVLKSFFDKTKGF